MLTLARRTAYQSLLDAAVLQGQDEQAPAIHYVATDQDPITITRQQFRERVQHHAATLRDRGIEDRDLVIIAHTQNLESIFAFWACLSLGAIPSMFPTLTEKLDREVYMGSIAELVRLSEVAAVLTTDEFATELEAVVTCAVHGSLPLPEEAPAPTSFVPITPRADAVAFLQHSSGTTGLQKGVALSHQAVLNQLAAYGDALHLSPDDVVVSWLPLYHDMGLIAGFLLPLMQGIPLVLMSPFDWVSHPALLLQAIHDYRGTLCWLPNFAYNHMARRIRQRDSEGLSLATMRAFINCSEPVREDSHRQFLQRFATSGLAETMLSVSYAMAENTFAVTQTPIGKPVTIDRVDPRALQEEGVARPSAAENALSVVSCGVPITNTDVRVLSASGGEAGERQVGEVAVRSDCMLRGYYQRPDLQPFVDGWYRTGDMGYLAAGEVYIIGRKKDLIINAGKNVYPQDIEAIINTIEGIHAGRTVVFGVPDEREGTELIAVVAETTHPDYDPKALSAAIRKTVARQTTITISFVHLVSEQWILKTSSGKVSRAANREKWLRETGRAQENP